MVRGDSQILCPVCDSAAQVKPGSSGHRLQSGELPRVRRCPQGHEFRTVERRQEVSLGQLMVRSPSMAKGRDSRYEPFDIVRLGENLQRSLLGTLERSEAEAIARIATDRLDHDVDLLAKELDDARYRNERSPFTHYILHTDVRARVLGALKSIGDPPGGGGSARHRVAFVLYGLSKLGNVRNADHGFADARDVADWLTSEFPKLPAIPASPPPDRTVEQWWPPTYGPPTLPRTVVKRHAKLRRRGAPESRMPSPTVDSTDTVWTSVQGVPTEDFIAEKFRASIEAALEGRPRHRQNSSLVADWVLWHLVGQEIVLTSQLGAFVADCFRRVDDVAYLRWVTVAKELRVSAIYHEAVGLTQHPSPQLRFSRSALHPAVPSLGSGDPTRPRGEL